MVLRSRDLAKAALEDNTEDQTAIFWTGIDGGSPGKRSTQPLLERSIHLPRYAALTHLI
jgi:hypothetical protein